MKQRSSPVRLLAALAATALLAPVAARAGELEVAPVLLELDGGRRSEIVTIRNVSQAPARYQVRAYAWDQDDRGTMQLDPTTDVVIYPPLVEMQAGEERKLRVGVSAKPDARERSYRIFIEEMPPPETPETKGQVRVLTRIGIPVFLSPAKVDHRSDVAFVSAAGGRASIRLRNAGTVRVRPRAIQLAGYDAAGTQTFEKALDAWYVLAGDERVYDAEIPADACARTRELRAVVETDPANLESRLLLPDRACAR